MEKIPNKSWASIAPALQRMLSSPGFERVTRLVSDKESALSPKNVASILPRVKLIRLHPAKAYRAERHIKEFKTTLSSLSRSVGNRTLFRYQSLIGRTVHLLNTKREVVKGIAPADINENNYLEVERIVNEHLYYPIPGKSYKFHVGDQVARKLDVSGKNPFTQKTSLRGFNRSDDLEDPPEIISRAYKPTGRRGSTYCPFYQLNARGKYFYAETQLSLLSCPHATSSLDK